MVHAILERDYQHLRNYLQSMKDHERFVFEAIRQNDEILDLKELFGNNRYPELTCMRTPILMIAITEQCSVNLIESIVNHGVRIRDHDANGYTAMRLVVWNWAVTDVFDTSNHECQGCSMNAHRLDLVKLFYEKQNASDGLRSIFLIRTNTDLHLFCWLALAVAIK